MPTFLEHDELACLTGRKLKSMQIAWLRGSGLRFWVNATGHPVVPRSAIDGTPPAPTHRQKWEPRVLQDSSRQNHG